MSGFLHTVSQSNGGKSNGDVATIGRGGSVSDHSAEPERCYGKSESHAREVSEGRDK